MRRTLILMAVLGSWGTMPVGALEVTGRVLMPATCSPAVSPAVVRLEPRDTPAPDGPTTQPPLIDQKAQTFTPRVVVVQKGHPVQFGNNDPEAHNVHIQAQGVNFNQSVSPGAHIEFVPKQPGPHTVICDIHSHMRAYIIVGDSPWVAACGPDGSFRFRDVPEGRYRLIAWHEMGDSLSREVMIQSDTSDLGTFSLPGRGSKKGAAAPAQQGQTWHDVTERMALLLSSALDAAQKPGGRAKAVTLAQDAYFGEFEASDMETAVRAYLGLARAVAIEKQFRDLSRALGALAEGRIPAATVTQQIGALLTEISRACDELNAKGVTDRSKVLARVAALAPAGTTGGTDHAAALRSLTAAFASVRGLADRGDASAAAAALGEEGYFGAFEPLERELQVREPGTVQPLESRFNALRGEIGRGLKGPELAGQLDDLKADIAAAVARIEARPTGGFGVALIASLGTILREGVEVILLLTMLIALVTKSGRADLLPALRWGVGLAAAASALTAFALNLLVRSTAGRTQELIEGLVMLVASAVLFYVSYWLISQSESKRWMAFLKRLASSEGATTGGAFALGLTAFLAIYREGAETALMYQSMLSLNASSRAGLAGLAVGLAVGLAILAVLYYVIRATSVRLPLRTFFQVTGVLLFAMSVVFAGHAVFELQSAEFIKTTPLTRLGAGIPLLGLHPNLQSVGVQAILVLGAVVGLAALAVAARRPDEATAPAAGVRAA